MPQLIFLICLTLSFIPANSVAVEQAARQDMTTIIPLIETYLQAQTGKQVSGQSRIMVTPPDPRLDLPACAKMEAFLPTGARLQGRITVGVRCFEPSPWTLYAQAQISVLTQYLVTALPLAQGHVITESDLTLATGEQTPASAGFLSDMAQAVGKTLAIPVAAGLPLRSSLFRKEWVIQQGQTVRLLTAGQGFRISLEVKAMGNAGKGEVVQVKTKSGRILSGIAKAGGVVELAH